MINGLERFDSWVSEFDWPRVECPICRLGTLGFESAQTQNDGPSRELIARVNAHEEGPGELAGTFVGVLKCDNTPCQQAVAIAGDWQYVFNEGDPERGQFGSLYKVRYLNPAPQLLSVPSRTPASVVDAIHHASTVVWLSPSAAANRLRQAIEELLTAERVRRTSINKYNKRVKVVLHDRIALFRSKRPEIADALEAVKWIGNEGSHDSELTVDDVLLGARILELALRAMYDRSDAELMVKVRGINKARGLR